MQNYAVLSQHLVFLMNDAFIMRPSVGSRIKRLSVPCLQLTRNQKGIKISNLVEKRPWTRVGLTERANLRLKGEMRRSLHGNENVKIVLAHIFVKVIDPSPTSPK